MTTPRFTEASFSSIGGTTTRNVIGQPIPDVPPEQVARGMSLPEYQVFRALLRTGRQEPDGFIYQSKFFGGAVLGGVIVDFVVTSPRVGIAVQSDYHHTRTVDQRSHDVQRREFIERSGLRLEFIDSDAAINRPDDAVADALAGILGRGPIGI